jgi:hypothetical protein
LRLKRLRPEIADRVRAAQLQTDEVG